MPILDAPFAYQMTFTPPRANKERTISVWDTTPVTVREFSDMEAPVVIRARRSDDNSVVEYRWQGQELFQPVRPPQADPGENGEEAPAVPNATRFSPLVPRKSLLREASDVRAVSDVPVKKLVSSGRNEGIASAHAHAATLRMIEGQLYELSAGPVFCLQLIENGRSFELISTDIYTAGELALPSLVYRADERDEALRFAQELFPKRKVQVSADAAEILAGRALTMDSVVTSAILLGRRLFLDGSKDMTMGSMPTAYLDAWLEYTGPDFDRNSMTDDLCRIMRSAGEALAGTRDGAQLAKAAALFFDRLDLAAKLEAAPTPGL